MKLLNLVIFFIIISFLVTGCNNKSEKSVFNELDTRGKVVSVDNSSDIGKTDFDNTSNTGDTEDSSDAELPIECMGEEYQNTY